MGLPIPGPAGRRVATLTEVAADDGLLRALDLDDQHRYPVSAVQLHGVIPWVEASPIYLSKRMALLEPRLAGANKVVLTENASGLAAELTKQPLLAPAAIWPLAYDVLAERRQLTAAEVQLAMSEMLAYRVQPQLALGRGCNSAGNSMDPREPAKW